VPEGSEAQRLGLARSEPKVSKRGGVELSGAVFEQQHRAAVGARARRQPHENPVAGELEDQWFGRGSWVALIGEPDAEPVRERARVRLRVAEYLAGAVGGEFDASVGAEHDDLLSERVEALLERGEHRFTGAVEFGVAVGVHQVRASEREQLDFAVGEVVAGAGERDPDDQRRAGGERERDLPLDADLAVELLVEREPVKRRPVDQVRDPIRAPVASALVPFDQRVLVFEF
jgi:hypothetical protein